MMRLSFKHGRKKHDFWKTDEVSSLRQKQLLTQSWTVVQEVKNRFYSEKLLQ